MYCQQLDRVKTSLTTKRPALINRCGVILQKDNARPHTAKITRQKLKDFRWEFLPHHPYSLDIAPSDYWLFRSLHADLCGKNLKQRKRSNQPSLNSQLQRTVAFMRKAPNACPKDGKQLPIIMGIHNWNDFFLYINFVYQCFQ